MRTRLLLFLVSALSLCHSQQATAAVDLQILPKPRQIEMKSGFFRSATPVTILGATKARTAGVTMLRDEMATTSGSKTASAAKTISLGILPKKQYPELQGDDAQRFADEGYILEVTPQRIRVSGATEAGIFYGIQTLRQLIRPSENSKGFQIPAIRVTDWPAMRWRGVHDDISRGPIPTMDYMKRQIRMLSEYKVNMFSLYMEHVFAFPSMPVTAPQEAAVTPANIRELVDYAARYHITLLPEQQAFGHLHHVLKYELYSDLGETPHGHVLSPVAPKTYDFIAQMYKDLIPLFPGPLFHIGGDETWELGTGQTKARADQVGLGKVYLEHIGRVNEIVKPYGKRLMFWGDIALHYPELLNILPKDAIAVAWVYDAKPNFDASLEPFAKAGLTLFVAPGANNWNRIIPDYHVAEVNIRNFTRDGQKYKALGQLNTTWDDDGEALFEMTWPSLVFGAAAAWQPGESSIDEFRRSYDWAFYRNAADHSFADAIERLALTHENLKQAKVGGAMDDGFWVDPFSDAGWRYSEHALPVAHDLRINAETALDTLYRSHDKARLHADTLPALEFGALRTDALGMKLQLADETRKYYRDAYDNQTDRRRVGRDLQEINSMNARLQDLRDSTARLKQLYVERWNAENKPYWLGSVTSRYDALTLRYESLIARMKTIRGDRGAPLPKPEELGFAPTPQPASAQPQPANPGR
jgi:hypothetical protein